MTKVLSKEECICPQCQDKFDCDHGNWETLTDSSDLFYKALKQCRVRGVAAIESCNKSDSDKGKNYVTLIQELIKRDILVIFSGCAFQEMVEADLLNSFAENNFVTGLAELCDYLDIPPLIYVKEDLASIDDFFADLSEKAKTDLCDLPVLSFLELKENTPGSQVSRMDIEKALEDPIVVDREIHEKRIGLKWYDHFDARYSAYS
ncbi:MAG: hypothetical protein PQJ60_06545 [Spirochaetales bacterium]|nr:hypothetical protein [Spirochaetales bacterium]